MRVKSKRIEGNMTQLKVTVTAKEVDSIIDQTTRGLINQYRIKLDDKTPIEELAKEQANIDNFEERVASGAVEAMIVMAISQENITPAYFPQIQQTAPLEQGRVFNFTIDVKPKPKYELTSYEPVEITMPKVVIDDAAVEEKCKEVLSQTVVHVGTDAHKLADGDSVRVKVHASINGEDLKGLCTGDKGLHYQIGGGSMPKGFDEALIGMEPGESKDFTFAAPDIVDGEQVEVQVDCSVTILECQKEAEPQMTDEWLAEYMPFYKSVDDLRAMVRENMEREEAMSQNALGCRLAAAEIAKRFQGKIEDAIYANMHSTVLSRITEQLQAQGKSYDDFKEEVGEQMASMQVMMETRQALQEGFALDAVFEHEGLTLTNEDIELWCKEVYPEVDPKEARLGLERNGRGFMMREGAARLMANRWLFEHAKITWEEAE